MFNFFRDCYSLHARREKAFGKDYEKVLEAWEFIRVKSPRLALVAINKFSKLEKIEKELLEQERKLNELEEKNREREESLERENQARLAEIFEEKKKMEEDLIKHKNLYAERRLQILEKEKCLLDKERELNRRQSLLGKV
jgi:dipeptidase